ncbi:hypothetical protein NL676_027999 [Syzygium grande]|nr:hypothetical protein NL676_027999 [Syzygium grande]
MLRLINAAMQDLLFFSVANHSLTVVATDASYTKPLTRDIITISPGQTIDVLLKANQNPDHYYMASRVYSSALGMAYDNTTTTAVPIDVPENITNHFIFTISINSFPCPNNSCAGPNRNRLATGVNNITFTTPSIDILQAYYDGINGVFGTRLPNFLPYIFNFTADILLPDLEMPKRGMEVKVLKYNSTVELVFQGTNLMAGTDHPMHLHRYSFYVVGWGLGNYDIKKDPLTYNLVDPPLQNTIAVPKNGWAAIRFRADNPGVWFMHCHIERHLT